MPPSRRRSRARHRGRDRHPSWRYNVGGVCICPLVKKQQGDTCSAHGIVGAQESRMRFQRAKNGMIPEASGLRLSVKYVVDNLFGHVDLDKDEYDCDGDIVADFLRDIGTIASEDYPEDGSVTLSDLDDEDVQHHKLLEWDFYFSGSEDMDSAENALLEGGPIVGMFDVTDRFYNLGANEIFTGQGDKEERRRSPGGTIEYQRHAVTILSSTGKGRGGCWRILNSWGEGWGDRGHGKIKKDMIDFYIVPIIRAGA